jgi:hypothetical protein
MALASQNFALLPRSREQALPTRKIPQALIAIRMSVAPSPIVPLLPGVLPVVFTVGAVLFFEITAVGAVFAVVPIVVIAMVPVVDAELDAGFLRSGGGDHCGRCSNGAGQGE